jgi:hypothetical protein
VDDRRRSVGSARVAAPPRPPAPSSPLVSRRAHTDRRLRPRVVRGACASLHAADVRRRRHERFDGAAVLRVGVGVLLLHGHAPVPRTARQAGGLLQRQGQHLPRHSPGGQEDAGDHAVR